MICTPASRLVRSLVPALLLVLLASASAGTAAAAGDRDGAEPRASEAHEAKKKRRFRIRLPGSRVRQERLLAEEARRAREATQASSSGAQTDALAGARPEGGIWTWIDTMGGEVPTDEQVEAIRETREEHIAEQELIDELAGHTPPTDFYRDPQSALATHPLYLDLVDPGEFDIPIEVNGWVEKWVRYFAQGNGRTYYARWLARAPRYQPMMREGLKNAGLPGDLVYLSMIESGYSTHAYSQAAAAGLWQFIGSTGREYGLRIDEWVDERRDPEAALHAAIAYLSHLHGRFGDWKLAWAAYNGGPGRLNGALQRAGTRDWWTLADGRFLHPETDNYVPKIMAAAIIGAHPDRYGFSITAGEPALAYDVAHVEGSVALDQIAKAAELEIDELRALNPALRRSATPPEGYDLRVPEGQHLRILAVIEDLPRGGQLELVRYRVRRGDTLAKIAARRGTTVETLKDINALRNENRITVGLSLMVPGTAREAPSTGGGTHTVARGETLSLIAQRYRVRMQDLVAWNSLSDASHIRVGQRLTVAAPSGGRATPAAVTHAVRRGETLSGIAMKYGVRMRDLQSWNSISDPSRIVVGQTLAVSGPGRSGSAWTEYVVRRGDSLGRIAGAHGVSVKSLQEWNSLRGTTIYPGQKLRIRGPESG